MKITRDELADMIADRLTAVQETEDLENFFYQYHAEFYAKEADDALLYEDALRMGILQDGEELLFEEDEG